MKTFNKYIALGIGALTTLASCDSLDTEYLGGYVTEDQKSETLEKNPEMALAAVTACTSIFSTFESVYANHFDFGYPAIMIGLDLQTDDYSCAWTGYNWFRYWQGFTSPSPQGTPSGMMWYHLYDQLYTANSVCATIPADTDDNELMFFRAQAMGIRAFDYWVLAQTYQFNYLGNQDKPCVPLLTEENMVEAAATGTPRATVQEVYDQILSDLDGAIAFLEKSTLQPSQVIDSKPKRLISKAVAYGLRARVNLTMHNYAAAAQDAQSAINAFSGAPYSRADVSKPTFWNIDDSSWMWGIAIAETDRVVTSGIVNFPSMVCSFVSDNCYVPAGTWKFINSRLWDGISNNDVRKGWFLNGALTSPNLSQQQQDWLDQFDGVDPYTNVKFGTYQNVVGQSTNASDIPLMRIEEMYYILAEAQAMSGNVSGGLETFVNFVRTYRNPNVATPTATTAEAAQNVIYQDRRVEFWGEGLAYFDMMRLNLPTNRVGTNFPAETIYQFACNPQEGACRIYCIPDGEINGNPALSAADNNPSVAKPTPVN